MSVQGNRKCQDSLTKAVVCDRNYIGSVLEGAGNYFAQVQRQAEVLNVGGKLTHIDTGEDSEQPLSPGYPKHSGLFQEFSLTQSGA